MTRLAADVAEQEPPAWPRHSLAGFLDGEHVRLETLADGSALPPARQLEDEARARSCPLGARAELDVDLREEVTRAGRDPRRVGMAVEARSAGRTMPVDEDRVLEVGIRTAGRPRQRAARPDEPARALDVGRAAIAEDEAEALDLVDAGEAPADARPRRIVARYAHDVVDAERRLLGGGRARGQHQRREQQPSDHSTATVIGRRLRKA